MALTEVNLSVDSGCIHKDQHNRKCDLSLLQLVHEEVASISRIGNRVLQQWQRLLLNLESQQYISPQLKYINKER